MEKKFVFIFDLDYTLLDTTAFKAALAEAVCAFGPSAERYEAAYQEMVHRAGKTYDYDPDVHMALLREDFPDADSAALARGAIDGVLTRTADFLKPGAEELLSGLRRQDGARLVLLTLGNRSWQLAKVNHSRLHELFDEVIATEEAKIGVVSAILKEGETAVIINDNGGEIEAMQEVLPQCEYVAVRGPKGISDSLRVPIVESMNELVGALEKITGWRLR